MRYRPFGHFNVSISAVSLVLEDDANRSADAWTKLIYAALENGVNGFEVRGREPAMIEGMLRAFEHVERRLVFVAWRIGPSTIPPQYADQAFQPQMVQASIQSALARTGLEYLDLVLLDDPGEHDFPAQSLTLLTEMKVKGTIRLIGVAGEGDAIDTYLSTRKFDCLALPFSMTSGPRERSRLRAAYDQDMAVVGYDFCPSVLSPAKTESTSKRRLWSRKASAAPRGAYDFLSRTPGWTRPEICLAYVLTEPTLATVMVAPDDMEALQTLAEVADREMPSGLSAQIEMARVMLDKSAAQSRSA